MRQLTTKTKIIWSLEKNVLDQNQAEMLANSLIDALRLVYVNDASEKMIEFLKLTYKLRKTSKLDKIPVIVDVSQLSRAAVKSFQCASQLVYGQKVILGAQNHPDPTKVDMVVECEQWKKFFSIHSMIYLGFGNIVLKTITCHDQTVEAEVIQGGQLKSGMDVHVPDTKQEPTMHELLKVDIKPFKAVGIDYVIIPGLLTVKEISIIKKRIHSETGENPWLILRVDSKSVYENIADLIPAIDGVMISRRELALSLEPALVPVVCKEIIQLCKAQAKLSIIASEMLGSMRFSPTPTRAEVSDVANAVIDGTDAIVLSEEIALGKYALRSLKLCQSIISDVEGQPTEHSWHRDDLVLQNELDGVAFHAYKTAERVQAKAIVCITKSGNTPLRLASFPVSVPIIAVTFSQDVERRLMLVRGVQSLRLDGNPNLDEVLPFVNSRLLEFPWISAGDRIVFVTVSLSSISKKASNLFSVQTLG